MASGSGRDVAALMRAVPGLLTKDGFEGVQVAALPDGRAVAVKIADGADRARVPGHRGGPRPLRRRPGGARRVRRRARCSAAARRSGSVRPARALDRRHDRRPPDRYPVTPPRMRPAPPLSRAAPPDRRKTRTAMTAAPTAASTTCSATVTYPPTRTGASTPCAPRRTSPSPARRSPRYPHLIDALAAVKEAAALANEDLGLLDPGEGGRHRRGLPGDPRRASCTTSSSST